MSLAHALVPTLECDGRGTFTSTDKQGAALFVLIGDALRPFLSRAASLVDFARATAVRLLCGNCRLFIQSAFSYLSARVYLPLCV